MGYKTRMVPEKYFIMELDDLYEAHDNFICENNMRASIHIIHPDASEDLKNEMRMKVNGHPAGCGELMYYMGVKIITSKDVKYEKIETY